jgi:hypothetical protein
MTNIVNDNIKIPVIKQAGEITLRIVDGKLRFSKIFDGIADKNKHFDCIGPYATIQISRAGDKMFICDSVRVTTISEEGALLYQYPLETIQNIVRDDLVAMLDIQN